MVGTQLVHMNVVRLCKNELEEKTIIVLETQMFALHRVTVQMKKKANLFFD